MFIPPTADDLIKFVEESNKIEEESPDPRDPMFQSNLTACVVAVSYAESAHWLDPRVIHAILMTERPAAHPGLFRGVRVRVGYDVKMSPTDVPPAMTALFDDTMRLIEACEAFDQPGRERDSREVFTQHLEFERIHPFRDGNGRSGRIFWNYVRLRCGLPWSCIKYDEREQYYQSIRMYELSIKQQDQQEQ